MLDILNTCPINLTVIGLASDIPIAYIGVAGTQSYSNGELPIDMSIARLPFKDVKPAVSVFTFALGGLTCSDTWNESVVFEADPLNSCGTCIFWSVITNREFL